MAHKVFSLSLQRATFGRSKEKRREASHRYGRRGELLQSPPVNREISCKAAFLLRWILECQCALDAAAVCKKTSCNRQD